MSEEYPPEARTRWSETEGAKLTAKRERTSTEGGLKNPGFGYAFEATKPALQSQR
jgi:hypothetical protein